MATALNFMFAGIGQKQHNLQLASRVENSRNAEILYIIEQAREARMLTSVMLSPICPYL